MKTKNLFRVLPLLAAVLLFAACSGDQNVAPVTEPETPAGKGTVIHYSATVSDGTTTRATLNGSKEYEFQTGDVLRITGTDISGDLTLTSGAGEATATFEGDLTFTGSGTPADDLALSAVLVSMSNAMTTLTYAAAEYPTTAIASTLAEAVEKYSHFTATSTYGDKNFSMAQQTSFLNFTVTLTDNRVITKGIQTCDRLLKFEVTGYQLKKDQWDRNVVTIDYTITNLSDEPVQGFYMHGPGSYTKCYDQSGRDLSWSLSVKGSEFSGDITTDISARSTIQAAIQIVDDSKAATDIYCYMRCEANNRQLDDEYVRFLAVPVK